jgi:ABC-type lipoprotein export system ATPase subunit
LLEEVHAGGTTIVMVTHDPELANRAERIIQLLDGRVLAEAFPNTHEDVPQAVSLNDAQSFVARA